MRPMRAWALMAAVIILAGCAAQGRLSTEVRWRSDPQADAAVRDGEFQQGLALHEKLLADDAHNCLALYHLGYIWGQLDNHAKEIDYYQRALTCGYDKDDHLFFNLGMAYAATGQLAAAKQAMERAVARGRDNADNYFGLGLVARRAGSTDEAVQAFQKAIALDPRNVDARVELIRIYLDLSQWEAARSQLVALEKVAPQHDALPELWETLHRRWVDE